MKKVLLLIFILFSSIALFDGVSNATSGACSSHSGVSCSAGADWDGSVICSDGWKDSTVMYYEMASCVVDKTPTVTDCAYWEAYKKVLPEYEVTLAKYQKELKDYIMNPDPFISGKGFSPSQVSALRKIKEDGIKAKIDAVKNKMISIKPKRFSEITYDIYCPLVYQNLVNSTKSTTQCIANATLASDGKCYCKTDYLLNTSGTSCVTKNEYCIDKYDKNAQWENNQCMCKIGYVVNSAKTGCTISQTTQSNSLATNLTTANTKTSGIFTDISSSHKQAIAIQYLKTNSIINGYSDGTFKPNNKVNRAELLKILIGNRYDTTSYGNCFNDVKNEWFAPYVCLAKQKGWVQGYSNGTFKPSQVVNRAEAIKMAIEVFGFSTPSNIASNPFSDVSKDAWFAKYVSTAKDSGLFDSMTAYKGSDGMTRGDISDIIYRLLVIEKLKVSKYQKSLDSQMN